MQSVLMKWYWRVRRLREARAQGAVFACNALNGTSSYNICINCDLSVSCNCQDYDGTGQIGNLRSEGWDEIFAGEKACALREALAAGRLPLANCSICPELQIVAPQEAEPYLTGYKPATSILLENTACCNLHCIACEPKKRLSRIRTQTAMSLDDLRLVADKVLAPYGIQRIAYFAIGEPFLSPALATEIALLREACPDAHLYTSTNGLLVNTPEKQDAALRFDRVVFSIDGCDDETLRRYQRGGSFRDSYANMKALVARRDREHRAAPAIAWKYVLFWWNDRGRHIARALRLAREAGVDKFLLTPTLTPLRGISYRYYILKRRHLHEIGVPVPPVVLEANLRG